MNPKATNRVVPFQNFLQMVAGTGFEPVFSGYEPEEMPDFSTLRRWLRQQDLNLRMTESKSVVFTASPYPNVLRLFI